MEGGLAVPATLIRERAQGLAAASAPAAGGATESLEAQPDDSGTLYGEPASRGRATGRCRVATGETAPHNLLPGEILIVHRFPMQWVPLLSRVGALVTEAGSALANVAILAREYDVPAVVDVKGATDWLRTGQVVTVDGGAGTVTY
jgi:pyruvate,water dikinase